jgi:cell division protein FtsI/penicillin-binding protein 2
MDGKTGAIFAAVSTPSFDPGDLLEQEHIRRQVRLNGGHWNPDNRFQNLAFRRQNHAGSVYKLATGYGMLQAGLLGEAAKVNHTPRTAGCGKILGYQQDHLEVNPETGAASSLLLPKRSPSNLIERGFGAQCDYSPGRNLAFDVSDASWGFVNAFKQSINGYFALGFVASAPELGLGFGRAPLFPWQRAVDPIVDSQNGVWRSGDHLILNFPPDTTPNALGSILSDPRRNHFLNVLLQTGHRFVGSLHSGLRASDRGYRLGDSEFVAYPSAVEAGRRWLPGLSSAAFVYPGIPAWYAATISGVGETKAVSLEILRGNGESEVRRFDGLSSTGDSNESWGIATPSLSNVLKNSFGYGGVQASALSLAVMTTPVAHPARGVVAPHILVATLPDSAEAVSPELFDGTGQEILAAALRAVLITGTATAPFINNSLRNKLGGKSGTYHIGSTTILRDRRAGDASVRTRIRGYACGVRGIQLTVSDWETFAKDVSSRRAGTKRQKNILSELSERVIAGKAALPSGFGGSAKQCDVFNPSGIRVGFDIDPTDSVVDGGRFVEALDALFKPTQNEIDPVTSSSFISVSLEPFSEETPDTQGWILAVLFDDDQSEYATAAKKASNQIWEDLFRYVQIRSANEVVVNASAN